MNNFVTFTLVVVGITISAVHGQFGSCIVSCKKTENGDSCPAGQECRFNGCGRTCQDVQVPTTTPGHKCQPVACMIFCANGWAKDEHGCDVCNCQQCEPVHCRMYCEHGWKKDKNGCDICDCYQCPGVFCDIFCQNGWAKDNRGCDTCSCA